MVVGRGAGREQKLVFCILPQLLGWHHKVHEEPGFAQVRFTSATKL